MSIDRLSYRERLLLWEFLHPHDSTGQAMPDGWQPAEAEIDRYLAPSPEGTLARQIHARRSATLPPIARPTAGGQAVSGDKLTAEWLSNLAATEPNRPDLRVINGVPYLYFEEIAAVNPKIALLRFYRGQLQVKLPNLSVANWMKKIESRVNLHHLVQLSRLAKDYQQLIRRGVRHVKPDLAKQLNKLEWDNLDENGKGKASNPNIGGFYSYDFDGFELIFQQQAGGIQGAIHTFRFTMPSRMAVGQTPVTQAQPVEAKPSQPIGHFWDLPKSGAKDVSFDRVAGEFPPESGLKDYWLFESRQYGMGVAVKLETRSPGTRVVTEYFFYSMHDGPLTTYAHFFARQIGGRCRYDKPSGLSADFQGTIPSPVEALNSLWSSIYFDLPHKLVVNFRRALNESEMVDQAYQRWLGAYRSAPEQYGETNVVFYKLTGHDPGENGSKITYTFTDSDWKMDVTLAKSGDSVLVTKAEFYRGDGTIYRGEVEEPSLDGFPWARKSKYLPDWKHYVVSANVGSQRMIVMFGHKGTQICGGSFGHIREILNPDESWRALAPKRFQWALDDLNGISHSRGHLFQPQPGEQAPVFHPGEPLPINITFPATAKSAAAFDSVTAGKQKNLQVTIQFGDYGTSHPYHVIYEHSGQKGVFLNPVEGEGAPKGVIELLRHKGEYSSRLDKESELYRWMNENLYGPELKVTAKEGEILFSTINDSEPEGLPAQIRALWLEAARGEDSKIRVSDMEAGFQVEYDPTDLAALERAAELLNKTRLLYETSLAKKRNISWRAERTFLFVDELPKLNGRSRELKVEITYTRDEEGNDVYRLKSATMRGYDVFNAGDNSPHPPLNLRGGERGSYFTRDDGMIQPGEIISLTLDTDTFHETVDVHFNGKTGIKIVKREIQILLETDKFVRNVTLPEIPSVTSNELSLEIEKTIDRRSGTEKISYRLVSATLYGVALDLDLATQRIQPGKIFKLGVDGKDFWAEISCVMNEKGKISIVPDSYRADWRKTVTQSIRSSLSLPDGRAVEDVFEIEIDITEDPWTHEKTVTGARLK
ncbi:MAG: hypothetical protein HY541_00370, partial [Deltaproteobacteria bacterium]|nr:hypothetical protein [Deltaproteobacteria bacterium]